MKFLLPLKALVIVIALVWSVLSPWMVEWSFNINQNYIASQLCENRNNAQMHCNGHCYLQKKLNDDSARQDTHQKNMQVFNTFVFRQEEKTAVYCFPLHADFISFFQNPLYQNWKGNNTFHPPLA